MKCFSIFLLQFTTVVFAQDELSFEKVVRYTETVSGNQISVVVYQRKFDFSKFRVKGGSSGSHGHAMINGVLVAGTDGKSPIQIAGWPKLNTVAKIELQWNNVEIPVSESLHINLLNLTLNSGSIQFIPRPNGEELLIQATGGDGGASYIVSLVLRENGKHKQYESGYHEGGLRPHPFLIEEILGKDSNGDTIVRSFSWLEPKVQLKK